MGAAVRFAVSGLGRLVARTHPMSRPVVTIRLVVATHPEIVSLLRTFPANVTPRWVPRVIDLLKAYNGK